MTAATPIPAPLSRTDLLELFAAALQRTLHHEGYGAFTNDPNDPGGATRWGITAPTLRRARKLHATTSAAWPTTNPATSVRTLTEPEAAYIYRILYWRPLYPAFFSDIAEQLFDTAVLQGIGTAIKILQRACLVKPDGVIGPRTREAYAVLYTNATSLTLTGHPASYLNNVYAYHRMQAIIKLVQRNGRAWRKAALSSGATLPSSLRTEYLLGWYNRVHSYSSR